MVLAATLEGKERCSDWCGHGSGLQVAATFRNYVHKDQHIGPVPHVHGNPSINLFDVELQQLFFLLNCIALSLSFSLSKKQLARSHRWLISTHLNFDPLSAVGAPRHGDAVPALRSGIKLLVQ